MCLDNVAEWLRRQPAKLMGFARVGSNPTVVDIFRTQNGGVAQMVERMLSMHEAQGSIPCSSSFDFAFSETQKFGHNGD